jgi:hypothetical protein
MTYAVERCSTSSAGLLSEQPYAWPAVASDPLGVVLRNMVEAAEHYCIPVSRRQDAATRFRDLADRWQAEVAHHSSIDRIAMHPAYQQIIGMGAQALPFIFRELQHRPGHWFWALRAITGVDPVPPAHRGRIPKMAEAWLTWARQQGIRW